MNDNQSQEPTELQISILKQESIRNVVAVQALLQSRPAKLLFEGSVPFQAPPTVIGLKQYQLRLAQFADLLQDPVPTGVVADLNPHFKTIRDVCYSLAKIAFSGNLEGLDELETIDEPQAEAACKAIIDFYDKGLRKVILELGGTTADFGAYGQFDREFAGLSLDRLQQSPKQPQ